MTTVLGLVAIVAFMAALMTLGTLFEMLYRAVRG